MRDRVVGPARRLALIALLGLAVCVLRVLLKGEPPMMGSEEGLWDRLIMPSAHADTPVAACATAVGSSGSAGSCGSGSGSI